VTPTASPALRASLAERLATVREDVPEDLIDIRVERVDVRTGDPVFIARPSDWPALRAAEMDRERATPYWAVPWPSGLALARRVAADPPAPGTRVLELGCGLALPSIVAARAGGRVTATDGHADGAIFAAHNLALNEVEGDVIPGDWQEVGDQLAAEPWPLVLAADVLYTRENVDTLLRWLPRLVAPGGEIRLADPGRAGTEEFVPAAKRIFDLAREPDPEDERITHYRLRPRG
jgi:predicted nicotinamide N-methyase